ncbi:ABC transporter permease [Salisediminibacterium selenitireducens]|uniref:ABC-2 type transporter n=1 Tax=Bacillus selenitireducens (strain ATCC 700615 / DSM 15326 / MLS10) TaxID=439292 RepID=D6XWI6_BACIE|nr:ABC transporter permease [Salisediminibacterium selenitireducens]ADH97828.1 ABC-2 type transporter [[Bacillus] selenitireducens MLS10]
MRAIFQLQIRRLIRSPLMVLSFLGLTLVFVFFLGGGGQQSNIITVQVYSDDALTEEDTSFWLDALNEHDSFHFTEGEADDIHESLRSGHLHYALELLEDDYRLWVSIMDERYQYVNGHVSEVYFEELRLKAASEQAGTDLSHLMDESENMALTLTTTSLASDEDDGDGFIYNNQLHSLFGMTLYFAMFTIFFSLTQVVEEKRMGTWDRIIISPITKSQVYLGHLAYTFLVGYAQIMTAFLVFRYLFDYDLGAHFGLVALTAGIYVFTIVCLGLLILGLVPSSERLQAVIPIASTAMAMLGGAFWPNEIVSNSIILTLSNLVPVSYAMDALTQISVYQNGITAITEQLGLLFLMGVLAAGIGINLMERRG